MTGKTVSIDATNIPLGRLASRVATILRGKTEPTFTPSKPPSVRVIVEHAGRVSFTRKKLSKEQRYHFSGYPGGLKRTMLRESFERAPERVVYRAIEGMLPRNRLRKRLLSRLTIKP